MIRLYVVAMAVAGFVLAAVLVAFLVVAAGH